MAKFLSFISPAIIVAFRLAVSFLLIILQTYVLRAFLRIIRSMQLEARKEKTLVSIAIGLIIIVNLPLMFFLAESLFSPRGLLIYTPPPRYKWFMRLIRNTHII